jgi:DNA-binding NarL/FixJ family response regulator
MGEPLRIAVVDDHPVLWVAIDTLLKSESGWSICDCASDIASAKSMVEHRRPDLVIVDISLRDSHGLDLIKDLRAYHPGIKLLAYSQHDEMQYGERTLRAGAEGYLMKSEPPARLLEAIRAILAGEIYMSSRLSKILVQQTLGQKTSRHEVRSVDEPRLTDRELTVLELMGRGFGTRQIAGSLSVSHKTIDAHRANLKRKLGLKDASQLLCYASKRAVNCC